MVTRISCKFIPLSVLFNTLDFPVDRISVHVTRMTLAFSKATVFAVHIESDAFLKRCAFKCLHFEERYQMYAFSMKTIAFLDRFSVYPRPNRIEM